MSLFTCIALMSAAWIHKPLLWFLFYLGLGCILLAVLYRWRNWSALEITRSFNTDKIIMEAGSTLQILLHARVMRLLPWPWIEIEDVLPPALARHMAREPKEHLVWARKGTVQYASFRVPNLPRGIHQWDTFLYQSGDPLGFVTYRGRIRQPAELLVYPRTIELPAWSFFPRRVEGAVMPKRTFNQSQVQLAGIRDYQPGDRFGLIDWKSTAKTGNLLSKEFEPLLMSFSLVVLDCTIDSWKRDYDPAFEDAVVVAASLVKGAVAAHIPTRFHSNYTRQRGQMSITSKADYYTLLGHLAAIDSDGRDIMTQMLYQELFLRDNNVVVVSSHRGIKLRQVLRHISVRGNAVTLIMVNGKTELQAPVSTRRDGYYTEIFIDKPEDLNQARAKEVI